MKKHSKLGGRLFTLVLTVIGGCVFLLILGILASNIPRDTSETEIKEKFRDTSAYLYPLEDKILYVKSELEKQGIKSEEYLTDLKIIDSDAKYEFSDNGIRFISIGQGWISCILRAGHVKSISMGKGSGLETLALSYELTDLNKPEKYFLDDPPVKQTEKKLKKEVASNEKIIEVVAQAEKYQEIIKKILENCEH